MSAFRLQKIIMLVLLVCPTEEQLLGCNNYNPYVHEKLKVPKMTSGFTVEPPSRYFSSPELMTNCSEAT